MKKVLVVLKPFTWLALKLLRQQISDHLSKDFTRRLATRLNEQIDVPGMTETQEQRHFQQIVTLANDVLETLLGNIGKKPEEGEK